MLETIWNKKEERGGAKAGSGQGARRGYRHWTTVTAEYKWRRSAEDSMRREGRGRGERARLRGYGGGYGGMGGMEVWSTSEQEKGSCK